MKFFLAIILSTSAVFSTFAQAQISMQKPILNLFELSIKSDKTDLYKTIAQSNITESLDKESGTLAMYSFNRKDSPNQTYMIEIYESDTAYHQHLKSKTYKEFIQKAPDILNKKIKIETEPQFLGDKKIIQNEKIINNLVIVDVKPEFKQVFKNIVIPEMIESLRVEEGVLAMYATIDTNNNNRWYFYEIYASEAAYLKHRETMHFKTYIAESAKMTTWKEYISVVPIFLKNKGKLKFEKK